MFWGLAETIEHNRIGASFPACTRAAAACTRCDIGSVILNYLIKMMSAYLQHTIRIIIKLRLLCN